MGARQHRSGRVLMRKSRQPVRDRADQRQQHAAARVGEHHRVAQVVDVFGRAGEMHEFELCGQRAGCRELLADESTRRP